MRLADIHTPVVIFVNSAGICPNPQPYIYVYPVLLTDHLNLLAEKPTTTRPYNITNTLYRRSLMILILTRHTGGDQYLINTASVN